MKNNIFGFRPNGIAIPRKLALTYLILFGVPTLIFSLIGQSVPAALTLCIGICVFVMTDVLAEQRHQANARLSRRIHGTIISCFSGAAAVFCLIRLVQTFIS